MSTTSDVMASRADVVILAGGKGKRLHPHTIRVPKPMMPIGDTSVVEILLQQLRRQGFQRVTLALSHLGDLIEEACGDGSRFGLELCYSREPAPLSTAGPLELVDRTGRPLLVVNGDVLTDLDFRRVLDFHRQRGADATVTVQELRTELDFGVVEVGEEGELLGYVEKPVHGHIVSIGVNVFEPEVIDSIEPGEVLSMPELIMRLRREGKKVFVYEASCLWQDIGRPEHYERALELFRRNTAAFLAP